MRTVIIIDGGKTQIDLIPENDTDKAVLRMIPQGARMVAGKATGYAESRGGYFRPCGNNEAVGFTFITTLEPPA